MSPQGDWAQRFSRFGEMGLTAGLKTEGNGYLYFKASSWSGAQVNEPGLLADLTGPNGLIIDNEGDVARSRSRGGRAVWAGCRQDFPHGKQQPQQRMDGQAWRRFAAPQHPLRLHENRIGPLEDDRVKGYDRMWWGAYGELFAGYWLMSSNQRINAFAGLVEWPKRTFSAPSTRHARAQRTERLGRMARS